MKNKLPLTEDLDFHYLLGLLPALTDEPEYAWLPELFSTIGYQSLLDLCEYAGGETIRIPTIEELSIAKAVHTHAISDVLNLQTSLDSKQNVLTAGAGIKIEDNIISSVGGSNIIIRKW